MSDSTQPSPFKLDAAFAHQPQLETTRLLLRPITPEDAPGLLDLYGDPVTGQFNAWKTLSTLGQAKKKAQLFQDQFRARQRLRWGLTIKPDDQIIGDCAFVRFDERGARAELGYNLVRSHWRKGYMGEALTTMIAYGFRELGLNRLEAVVMPENEASQGLLRSIGFAREGLMRQAGYMDGTFCDLELWALLSTDFERIIQGFEPS